MGWRKRSDAVGPEVPGEPPRFAYSDEGTVMQFSTFGEGTDIRAVHVEFLGEGLPLEVGAEFTMRVVGIDRMVREGRP